MTSTWQVRSWMLAIERLAWSITPAQNFVYDENVKLGIHSVVWYSAILMWGTPLGMCQKKGPESPAPLSGCAPLVGQVLRCSKLGFTYKVPFGWVDRTADMQQEPVAGDAPPGQTKDEQTGKTLLAIFERPPGAPGDSLNSAVVIAIEDRSSYPQLKLAADYFGPLSEIAERRGLKMDGDPYIFRVGSRQTARGDFAGGTEKAPIRQTSLVLMGKNYILSFTFLSSSDDEIDGLIENLTFINQRENGRPK